MFVFTAALALVPLSFAAPLTRHLAPIRRAVDVGGDTANDGYIVAIKPNTVNPANRGAWLNKVLSAEGVTLDDATTKSLKLKWDEDIFNGLAGPLSTEAVEILQKQPEVAWIQEDIKMHTTAIVQQTNAPWGIARLSTGKTSLTGNNPVALNFKYTFDDSAGAGTQAFIVDTGCRVTHKDYGGRATFVASFGPGVPGQDINGHGTHVTGTIGGNVFGVAKKASLNCIKVMADDGSGATSDIISGINLAAQKALASGKPSVISMSLGGPINQAIDSAVNGAITKGVPFVVAAGNETQDANNVSPARVPNAITVGASTIDDTFASFSNFGNKVDITAPGQDILSAGFQADDAVAKLSGTSMATPHISGLSLLIMGQEGKLSPDQLTKRLTALSITNAIQGVPQGTANDLAFNGVTA
jgi:cerevisin